MKGTGIKRIAPCLMMCVRCNKDIMPTENFIWWHKIELDTTYNFVFRLLPTHVKCWNLIDSNKKERKLWKKLLDVINVVKQNILYIKLRILKS